MKTAEVVVQKIAPIVQVLWIFAGLVVKGGGVGSLFLLALLRSSLLMIRPKPEVIFTLKHFDIVT